MTLDIEGPAGVSALRRLEDGIEPGIETAEREIIRICSEVLGRPGAKLKMHKSFLAQGGDSLLAIKLMGRCRESGYALSIADILQAASISQLCQRAQRQAPSAPSPITNGTNDSSLSVEQQNPSALHLTQIQERLARTCATRTKMIRLGHAVSHDALATALTQILDRHAMLGADLATTGEANEQLRLMIGAERNPSLCYETREVSHNLEEPDEMLMDMATWPRNCSNQRCLFYAVAFVRQDTQKVVYLGIRSSCAVMDATSWDILIGDLDSLLCGNKLDGRPERLFSEWVNTTPKLGLDWASSRAAPECQTSSNGVSDAQGVSAEDPVLSNGVAKEHARPSNPSSVGYEIVNLAMDEAMTQLLFESSIHDTFCTEPIDFVAAAAYLAFRPTGKGNSDAPNLYAVIDGRSTCDTDAYSAVVGCFDTLAELDIRSGRDSDDLSLLWRIRDATTKPKVPPTSFTADTGAQVLVNLTNLQRGPPTRWKVVEETVLTRHLPEHMDLLQRPLAIYLEPFYTRGHLQFDLAVRRDSMLRSTLNDFGDAFQSALVNLLSRFRTYDSRDALPRFPLLDLTYPEARELVSRQLRRITPNPSQEVECVFPCTAIQEVFLVSQAVHPDLYQCSVTVEISSATAQTQLDEERLQVAWARTVERHAALRTVFIESVNRPGHFDQVVLKRGVVPLEHLSDENSSVPGMSMPHRPAAFQNYQATHRVAINKRSAYIAHLKVDISHALADGESMRALLRDLSQAYGNDHQTFIPMAYQNFMSYQQRLSREDSISYWSNYLRGAQPCLFPTTGDSLSRRNLRRLPFRVNLSPERLEECCSKFNVTIANICQVAWALVLRSYTGSQDVCFSFVTSGRQVPLRGIENTIGAFVDTIICRVKLSPTTTVEQALVQAKCDFVDSLARPCVFATGQGAQGKALSPLLGNTIMSFQRSLSGEIIGSQDLEFKVIDAINPTEYDISLNIQAVEDGLEVVADFWESRVDKETLERVSESFQKAVISLVGHVGRLTGIDVVSSKEIAQIREWNKDIPPRMERLIQDPVFDQCLRQPSAKAVEGWDGDLTYEELDREANKLASHLNSLGVKPESKIPLCFEKSKWAVVSQLAVLKAGGCVVPLGTKQPTRRIELILRDINASIILTSEKFASRFEDKLDHVVIVDDTSMAQLRPSAAPTCLATPDTSAFIIYTSGSTGVPKGVVLTHGSLCTSLHYLGAKFKLSPRTRMVQFSAYTFDISIQDIYTTWNYGGCVCIVSEEDRINNLPSALHHYRVNCAGLTSTVAGLLSPDDLPALETLVLLGEAVKPAVVSRWINHADVFNAYGPSECSIQASCNQLTPTCNALNIGRAFAGALWVVDANDYNCLVPIGAPGELLIEGPLQARGYLNDEAKTAAAFVYDPSWVSKYGFGAARRFYRTGDLVQQNPDGSILYIGRRDTQIKLRGQRVEVGEIEHALIQHPSVLDAAIVYPQQGPCRERLLGLLTLGDFMSAAVLKSDVVPVSGENLAPARRQAAGVCNYLTAHVPEHMIPKAWIPISSMMPQNESGKLDRKKLTVWAEAMDQDFFGSLTEIADTEEQTRSATPLEQEIRNVYAEVLNLQPDHVPVEQRSFVSLGGDSITAMQVVSRSRTRGITLLVRDVLQSKCIAQLALTVRGPPLLVDIVEDPEGPFLLSPIQAWYFESISPNGTDLSCGGDYRYNQSICLASRQPLAAQSIESGVADVVLKHPMLRSRFHIDSAGVSVQRTVAGFDGSYQFTVHDVSTQDEAEAVMAKAQSCLNLECGPVFSARLIHITESGKEKQLLFMVAHHLVIDIMSWRIILRDLDLLLRGQVMPGSESLTFERWTRYQAEVCQAYAAHQTDTTEGVVPCEMTVTGADYWGLAMQNNYHNDQVTADVILDQHHTSLLFGSANRPMDTEPVEVMIAALLYAFQETFPDRQVPVIFNEGHGRESNDHGIDPSDTVGWFTTIAPIHVGLAASDGLISTLKQTKDARRRIPQRGLPYFASRFLTVDGRKAFSSHREMEVLFNYAGKYQQLARPDSLFDMEKPISKGASPIGDQTRRPSFICVEVSVVGEALHFSFQFNRLMKHCHEIEKWAQMSTKALKDLVTALVSEPRTFTLSDFPLLRLTDEGLENLHHKVLPPMGINPSDVEDIYPCSPTQQGILMSQVKVPSEYQIQQSFELRAPRTGAPVSADRLIQAWGVVVNRHPMLRTVFVPSVLGTGDSLFDQVVLRYCEANTEHLSCGDDDVAAHLTIRKVFNGSVGDGKPNHKLTVYSTPSHRTYGKVIISHALVDATSLMIIQKELLQVYEGKLATGGAGPLYSEYLSYLQRTPAPEAVKYWTTRLADAQVCDLPALTTSDLSEARLGTDSGRPPLQSVTTELGSLKALQLLHEVHGITTANVFQLAWALVLSQYTGSTDVCFGYLTSGRDVAVDGVHDLVGPLINIMVTRINLDLEIGGLAALQKVQEDFLEGFNHQRASLLEIWHALQLNGQSLFNTSLSYRHSNYINQEESDYAMHAISSEDPTEYDANVNVIASDDGISVTLQYSPDFMSGESAARLVRCLVQAVQSLGEYHDLPIGKMRIVAPQDIDQLRRWNLAVPTANLEHCIHDVVQQRRILKPKSTAVHAWDGDLTYQMLDDLADRLAHHLVENFGVGPEVMVTIGFEKSRWAVVAQLAVLKAGGVVVSINPKHPMERLQSIITDTESRVLLTSQKHIHRLAAVVRHVLTVDLQLFSDLPTRLSTPYTGVKPENAAFIIYTSGSTGVPKGVVLTHYSLWSSFQAHGKVYGMSSDTRTVQFASYTFDASISDIWATICHGGCVCVISEDERMNDLQAAILSYECTLAQLTPTVASLLDLSLLPSLTTLVLGGEAVKADMIEEFLTADHVRVLNGYGPSECSIYTTCGQPLKHRSQASNIGRPLAGGVWVADDENIRPIGSVGELWIEGPLLAREYLNDKLKTDKSFVTNPIWACDVGLDGCRFYRTGDLVRQGPTGDIIYVGRRDTQIKIRGQRVEIGEIEYQVKKYLPDVTNVVATLVIPNRNARNPVIAVAMELNDDVQLASSGESTLRPMSSGVREVFVGLHLSLSEVLPLYMIPSLFVPVVQVPLTLSGKLDRRLLRQTLEDLPDAALFQYALENDCKTSPSTRTEERLQLLWASVLGIDREEVGATDNFLHSGGDSFTAMRLVSLANGADMPLSVSDVFRWPKLTDMARSIDRNGDRVTPQEDEVPRFGLWSEAQNSTGGAATVASLDEQLDQVSIQCGVSVEDVEDVYPCTPLQEGLMAITSKQPSAYVGRWAYGIPNTVDTERFKTAWQILAKIAPILRSRIVLGQLSSALQVVVRGEVDWLSGSDLDQYLRADTEQSITYGSPLVRLAIICTRDDQRYFVLTAHHSAYDGWSLAKMFDTVWRAYSDMAIPAAPSFTRFIRHLSQLDQEAAARFWKSQLAGDLPVKFPALPYPAYQPQPSETLSCRIQVGSLTGSITVAAFLQAAWALVISSYTDNSVLFASPLSGRAAPVSGILDMLAPTITTVPIHIHVDNTMSIQDYMATVQQQAIDMIPYEHTGLQHIRRLVGAHVDPGHLFAIQPSEDLVDQNNLGLEPITIPSKEFDSYALTIECVTGRGDGQVIEVEARFDGKVISVMQTQRLLNRFKHAFTHLVQAHNGDNGKHIRVGAVERVSPEEVNQLYQWNGLVPNATESLVHELVHRQSLIRPEEPAVCSWDGELSHRDLDQLAETLALYLTSLGVGRETMVPLCFDKSKWAVVSILAVLKAGGAVVPIKADPILRAEAIIRDTSARVILVTPHYTSVFKDMLPHIIAVDNILISKLPVVSEHVPRSIHPGDAAFVIYTSGSTGTPKGVVTEHRAMSTSMQAHGLKFGMSPKTRAFQFAAFTFDISLHDMITTLQFGGCVCLPSEEERVNDLSGAMRRMEVNYSFLTPRVLHTLLPSDVPKLQTLIVGGEAVQVDHVEHWARQVRTFNAYGPAECSIISTCNHITDVSRVSTIGHALAGALWVVDATDYNQLLPIGAVGELLIEGPLLARGYLNDSEKTSRAFITNPSWVSQYGLHSSQALPCDADERTPARSRRMYCTGDLVRQNDDGALVYVGRKDSQIKIRGQRVEIGEVEHHVTQHPAVVDAVVLQPNRGPARARLVGIITLQQYVTNAGSEVRPTVADQLPAALGQACLVREHLLEHVPEYMVPDSWVSLQYMPQNASNKIDRRKLLQWLEGMDPPHFDRITSIETSEALEAPENTLQTLLQAAIADVLHLPLSNVSLGRSFLSLGGDSITAMQFVSRCRSRYGISVLVRDVLQSKSIRQLALKAAVESCELQPVDALNTPFDLSPIQQLYFQSIASQGVQVDEENRFNQSVCLVTERCIDAREIENAANALVSKHAMLRARFHESDNGWRQSIEPKVEESYHIRTHHVRDQAEADEIISLSQRHLNLEDGPVFSVDLIHVTEGTKQLLFLAAHHLVVDIVSWRTIVRDLEDFISNPALATTNSALSFQAWIQLLSKHCLEIPSPAKTLPIETTVSDWDYWGISQETNVFRDRAQEQIVLDDHETSMLFDESQPLRTEPIEVLLAALFHSFHVEFPDRPVPTIFNEGHGREPWADSIDISGTVGWFTTMTPLHIVADSGDVIDILRKTKDARRSIPERGLAYFASRFLTPAGRSAFASHSHPEVTFNYTGRYQQSETGESLFKIDGRPSTPRLSGIGGNVKRLGLFEVEASVVDNNLRLSLSFSKKIRSQDRVLSWVRCYHASLKEMLRKLSAAQPEFTLSDFPSLNITYGELAQLQAAVLPRAGVSPQEVEDVYPCSPIQQGILMSQMKDEATYRVQQVCEILPLDEATKVDVERLAAAWQVVVCRHPILRTIFVTAVSSGELFYQVVLAQFKSKTPIINYSGGRDAVIDHAKAERPGWLESQPPHQLTIYTTTSGQTYCRVDVNHALMDASSLALVLCDLVLAYGNGLSDSKAPSYGSYISFLQESSAVESLDYWTHRLANAQPCYLPPFNSNSAARCLNTVTTDIEDLTSLHNFRDTHGITIANIVQLAWATVLARYTGSNDIIFGYLANGRDAPIPGINEMAGPMINMMVSRIELGVAGTTVLQAAERVQENFLEAFNNQRTSLADIQHALQLSEQGLFNTTVSYNRQPAAYLANHENLIVKGVVGEDPTEYDVNVNILTGEKTMRLSIQYSSSFLDDFSARSLLDALQHSICSISGNPSATLDELQTITPSEVERLRQWNPTVPTPVQDLVQDRIRRQRFLQPDAPAVCAWDGRLTYSDLDDLANRLAKYLTNCGVCPEVMVALCFEKSMWTIIAMLAVLRAGGVIVPLGSQLPAQRLRLILNDTQATIILASKGCSGIFNDTSGPSLVTIDSSFFEKLSETSHKIPSQEVGLAADNAAVVIYTSGSTGVPKGVVLTHGALCTSMSRHGAKLNLGVRTRTLQFSSYVFDISLLDIFGTLCHGGCVCVVSETDRVDIKNLSTTMEDMCVNFAVLTPTVASLIDPAAVPNLRTLGLAGEPVQHAVLDVWFPHAEIFNCYGPAECTVLATINGPLTDKDQPSNIGKPMAGLAWVVNQENSDKLVPIGAVGELLIEGPLLARGYLHDSEKTDRSFVTDPSFVSYYPFGADSNRRMYRTGDLVRQNPADGSIAYIGRADGQVKVRGQRVEVGEIEYCAKKNFSRAHIVAAGLIMAGRGKGDATIILAIEMQPEEAGIPSLPPREPLLQITPSLRLSFLELQSVLAAELPSFMVPTAYVPLERMPMTDSGKVDRKSLQTLLGNLDEAQLSHYSLSETIISECITSTECKLQTLWMEALDTSRKLGRNAHFFRSGGDSVTAMRLVALARNAEPPLSLSVSHVLKNPILEDMARVVDERLPGAESTSIAIEDTPFSLLGDGGNLRDQDLTSFAAQCNENPGAIIDAYPCTPLQQGLLTATERQNRAYINRWVFRVEANIDLAHFKRSWDQVFERASILRTRVIADHKYGPLQVVIREEIDWLVVSSGLDVYLARDSEKPMGFGSPLVRFAIVTDESSRFFVWTAHHSVYDGWTADKLMETVSRLYSSLPAPAIVPYTRFIRYLQQTASAQDTERYWRSQLEGSHGVSFPSLPPGHLPNPSQVLARSIQVCNRRTAVTTATLLRATWSLVLASEMGCQDVLFAAPLSGRTAPVPGILDILAPTVTTVPVRIRFHQSQTLSEYLENIQQQATDMIHFEHTGLHNILQMTSNSSIHLGHLFVVQPSAESSNQIGSKFPGLEPVPVEASMFHDYPLVMECITGADEQNDNIKLLARFDSTALSEDRMLKLLQRFEHIFSQLEQAAVSTRVGNDRLLGDVDIVCRGDIEKLQEWNPCPRSIDQVEVCVHDLVYKQQLSQPNSQAVCARDGSLSHAQLDELASRLAHHLVGLGVGPETAVASIFEKSQWAIVAQLAILKAGGVVVSVNPKHPAQRIQGIIDVTAARVILTSQPANCYVGLTPHVLTIDKNILNELPQARGPACEIVRATNSAFIIFTSGSTGTPKGVILEHGAVVTSLLTHGPLWSGPNTRMLQFGAYTFDVSITEIFATLILGGCVCVISEEDRMGNLATSMEALGVNVAYLTPTVASLIRPLEVPTLDKLIFIGEPLKPEVAIDWVESHTEIYNGYGPTECSILSTVSRRITDPNQALNIGTSLPNVNAWVVDPSDYHLLSPLGSVGELLLEGPLLARGYLGDDEKTAKAFVSDPGWLKRYDFGLSSGRRFYRTGDLVKQNLDGSFVCLGRRDTQVKIHGQRVEIGEIELCVKNNFSLAGEIVVGLVTVGDSEPGIVNHMTVLAVAIEVPAPDGANTLPQGPTVPRILPMSESLQRSLVGLRGALAASLPAYMVPQLYLPVPYLPLTDSGKLDRQVLQRITGQPIPLSPYFLKDQVKVAPSTPMELYLQELWAAVLGVPVNSISATDDFFSSGGNSMSAMRLVSKARSQGRLSLSVASVFLHSILSDMAKNADWICEKPPVETEYKCFSALQISDPAMFIEHASPHLRSPGAIMDAAPATDFQAHSVIASLRPTRDLLAYISIDGDGVCNVPRWKASCQKLVECHEILRTAYIFHEERLFQVVLQSYKPEIPHFETESGQTIHDFSNTLIAQDMYHPPCLGRPFLEFAIITSKSCSQHRILFRLSHGEYDAISMSYLINTLKALYDQQPVPEHPSFTRYAHRLSTQRDVGSLQYWRSTLRGSSMTQIVPMVTAPDTRFSKLVHHATRKIEVAKVLPTGITVSGIVKAAWALTLANLTNSRDVVFGEVVSGRNMGDPVSERSAGCCTNIVPVRAAFEDTWTISTFLSRLQEARLTRLPHETIGFREILRSCTDYPRSTHFTSQLNHLDQAPRWALNIGGVGYDISLAFPEGAQDLAHISVTSVSHIGAVEIHFGYLEKIVPPWLASELLDKFCVTIDIIANGSKDALLGSVFAQRRQHIKRTTNHNGTPDSFSEVRAGEPAFAFGGDLVDAGWIAFKLGLQGESVTVDNVLNGLVGP